MLTVKQHLNQMYPTKTLVYVPGMQQTVYCKTMVFSNLRKRIMFDVNGNLLRWRYKPVGLAN